MGNPTLLSTCFYCGEYTATTWDHLVPKALGGNDLPTNLVRACSACNQDKKTHTLDQYRRLMMLRYGIEPDASLCFPGEDIIKPSVQAKS